MSGIQEETSTEVMIAQINAVLLEGWRLVNNYVKQMAVWWCAFFGPSEETPLDLPAGRFRRKGGTHEMIWALVAVVGILAVVAFVAAYRLHIENEAASERISETIRQERQRRRPESPD